MGKSAVANPGYAKWLLKWDAPAKLARYIATISSLITGGRVIYGVVTAEFQPQDAIRWVAITEFLILTAFLVVALDTKENEREILERDSDAGGTVLKYLGIRTGGRDSELPKYLAMLEANAGGFRLYWIFLWFSWMMFYVYKITKLVQGHADNEGHYFWCSVANNATSMCLLGTYYFIASPCPEKSHYLAGLIDRKLLLPLAGFATLIVLDYQVCYYVSRTIWVACAQGMAVFEGILSCVILSMWIGRVDSKYLSPPRFLIAILYVFAAAQLILPLMVETNVGLALVAKIQSPVFIQWTRFGFLCLGLVGKVIMFWIIMKCYTDGLLMIYFVRLKQISDDMTKRDEILGVISKLRSAALPTVVQPRTKRRRPKVR
jgi:hypothetical protein